MDITNKNAYRLCRGYDVLTALEKFFEKNNCPLDKEQRRILNNYWEVPPNKLDLYRYVDKQNNFKNIGYFFSCLIIFIYERQR